MKFGMCVAAVGAIIVLAGSASAQVWSEQGDAGELPGTAQQTLGFGALTTISGALAVNTADMFQITITDPALFSASTDNAGTNFDTILMLFSADGRGVLLSDDVGSGTLSTIVGTNGGLAGTYYLAISGFAYIPSNASGWIWSNSLPNPAPPNGPGAADPITGWDQGGAGGDYVITLTGASFVPTPGAAALLGLGGMLVGRRRR